MRNISFGTLADAHYQQDPFRGSPNILVLAECWNSDGTPNKFNYRHECAK